MMWYNCFGLVWVMLVVQEGLYVCGKCFRLFDFGMMFGVGNVFEVCVGNQFCVGFVIGWFDYVVGCVLQYQCVCFDVGELVF